MIRRSVPEKTHARSPRVADPAKVLPRFFFITLIALALVGTASPAWAQTSSGKTRRAANTTAATTQSPADDEDDAVLDPAEPDFVVVNLPTTMRAPVGKGNFRITHRFAGNLRNGTFGELAGNLFGIDQGAIVGFEYRRAVARGVQVGVYRTTFDKTFQFHGKYDAVRQRGAMPVSVSAVVSIEGTDNFQDKYAPSVGAVISHRIRGRVAVYAAPIWVNNTAASLGAIDHQHGTEGESGEDSHVHRSTTYLGLGGRVRVLSSVYLVGEITPRLDGYAPDHAEYGFGLEKRVGSHMFSLTFTNTFGTTTAQLARGGAADTLYFGFNLGRKFF